MPRTSHRPYVIGRKWPGLFWQCHCFMVWGKPRKTSICDFYVLKKEAAGSTVTLVSVRLTTRRHVQEDGRLHCVRHQNFGSHRCQYLQALLCPRGDGNSLGIWADARAGWRSWDVSCHDFGVAEAVASRSTIPCTKQVRTWRRRTRPSTRCLSSRTGLRPCCLRWSRRAAVCRASRLSSLRIYGVEKTSVQLSCVFRVCELGEILSTRYGFKELCFRVKPFSAELRSNQSSYGWFVRFSLDRWFDCWLFEWMKNWFELVCRLDDSLVALFNVWWWFGWFIDR